MSRRARGKRKRKKIQFTRISSSPIQRRKLRFDLQLPQNPPSRTSDLWGWPSDKSSLLIWKELDARESPPFSTDSIQFLPPPPSAARYWQPVYASRTSTRRVDHIFSLFVSESEIVNYTSKHLNIIKFPDPPNTGAGTVLTDTISSATASFISTTPTAVSYNHETCYPRLYAP